MTIRHVLLGAFLGLILVASGALTVLAYDRSRTALERQIRLNLEAQATALMARIDALMFERLQNLVGWRRLEVMQELRLDDLDKRLARFLRDLVKAYHGVYQDLVAIHDGRIAAAADPARIGLPAPLPPRGQGLRLNDTAVLLGRPQGPPGGRILPLEVTLEDAYSHRPLGRLRAEFDWSEVERLLDAGGHGESGIHALLMDARGQLLATSLGDVGEAWGRMPGSHRLVAGLTRHGTLATPPILPPLGPVLLSWAGSTGYRGLGGLGWKVLVLTSEARAFAPVRRLLEWMLGLLGVTIGATGLLAIRIAARVSRPLQRLTDYTRRFARDRKAPIPEVGGSSEVAELGAAFHDLSEALQRYEADLLRMGKLAAAGEMAANLSHEIRTPLGILRSSAQLLARRPGLDPEGREMATYIIEECDRINQLVSALLDAARPRPPEFLPTPLAATLEQVRQLLLGKFEHKGIHLEIDLDGAPQVLTCDRDQLKQMLFNLLLNAVQVLPPGGRVEVHARPVTGGVEIQVDDDGPGVPAAERERILEPFVSRRAGGTGLGLSIVQQLARLHGGRLRVDASPLGGARFSLYLQEGPEP